MAAGYDDAHTAVLPTIVEGEAVKVDKVYLESHRDKLLVDAATIEKAKAFFSDLKKNEVQVVSGNKQVASAVGSGQALFRLTDTDDAIAEVDRMLTNKEKEILTV